MSAPQKYRRICVVDIESSGLRPTDLTLEVAWHDLGTDDRGTFVPAHCRDWVRENGQPDALEMNGYWRRLTDVEHDDGTEVRRLHHALRGQVLAGASPQFDAGHLARLFEAYGLHREPHHHRLLDLSGYAAGVLGLHPGELPGLSAVCDLLGTPGGDHTAEADVAATVAAFKVLFDKAGVQL